MQTNENNYAEVVGVLSGEPIIDHVLYAEGFYRSVIDVKRMSGVIDRIPVTIPQRLMNGDRAELLLGQTYRICGQLRSYNKCTEQGGEACDNAFCARALHYERKR